MTKRLERSIVISRKILSKKETIMGIITLLGILAGLMGVSFYGLTKVYPNWRTPPKWQEPDPTNYYPNGGFVN